MNQRDTSFILRWVSLLFLFAALVLTAIELTTYSRTRSNYPAGMSIAGIPIGEVDSAIAAQRLLQVYSSPVELRYADAVIHLDPQVAGFTLDTESMIAAADLQRTGAEFWSGFWNYLWNNEALAGDIPLRATISEDRLRAYLKNEIASRYDQPATPAQPIPGETNFAPGTPGQELDIDRAVILISDALRSPANRVVALTSIRTQPGRPTIQNLQTQIQQVIDSENFDGIVGFYMLDLQNGQELHFGYRDGASIPVSEVDIAFSASSTIKVPILVSAYHYLGPEIDSGISALILNMIATSENTTADAVLRAINEVRAPLMVSEDMSKLGLENTFLGAFFYLGAPPLQVYNTPANERVDAFTDPDVLNQTTPSDMGSLLADLYQCAESNGGALVAAYPDRINQRACKEMIGYLKRDKIGVLLEAGLPEETPIAHKHGWVQDAAGKITDMSDAAIIYTPGGDYALTMYITHPIQIVFDQGNRLFAKISQAVYNYHNFTSQ
jgi:beta-lactamase class A